MPERVDIIHSCPLTDTDLPLAVVEVVEYLDEDGDRAYAVRYSGTSPVSTILGLLDLAKVKVLQSAEFPDDKD